MFVDFYVPDIGLLVQITVGQKHGVKRKGLHAALKSGIFDGWRENNPDEKLRLVFLCDSFNFDQYTKQPYLTSKGITSSIIEELNNTYEQHAWELDVDQQLQLHLESSKKPTGRFPAVDSWDTAPAPPDKGKGKGKGKAMEPPSGIPGPSSIVLSKKRKLEDVDS